MKPSPQEYRQALGIIADIYELLNQLEAADTETILLDPTLSRFLINHIRHALEALAQYPLSCSGPWPGEGKATDPAEGR